MIYKIARYRRKVVNANLKNSFPLKTDAELEKITMQFYRFFCDLIVETIKTLTISAEGMKKLVSFDNCEIYLNFYRQNRSVIIITGHFGNWELGGARFSVEDICPLFVIFHPLKNKYFNKLIVKMRTRLGTHLLPMHDTLRGMAANKGKITTTAFIADQTPVPKNVYWITFLNQETPVFSGPEKIAVKFNYPVVYVAMRRPKRGHYILDTKVIAEFPATTKENEITEKFFAFLEADIKQDPELWLWTHRRWKHKRRAHRI